MRSRRHRPGSVTEAIRRINDFACVCGRCRSIRRQLEEKIEEVCNPNLDLTIDLADLQRIEIFCRKVSLTVSPLELGCFLFEPAENMRVIWVTFRWSQNQKFS